MIFQSDGNLGVYTSDNQWVWSLDRMTDLFKDAVPLKMQSDGNLVMYEADDTYLWSALNKDPDASAMLKLTSQGVLQLVSGNSGKVLLSSH